MIINFYNYIYKMPTKQQNTYIALGLLVAGIGLLIYFTRPKKSTGNADASGASSDANKIGGNGGKQDPVAPIHPAQTCFVPENQKFNCNRITSNDNINDVIRCLKWHPMPAQCDILRNVFNDPTCGQEYHDLYHQLGCESSDPVKPNDQLDDCHLSGNPCAQLENPMSEDHKCAVNILKKFHSPNHSQCTNDCKNNLPDCVMSNGTDMCNELCKQAYPVGPPPARK